MAEKKTQNYGQTTGNN